MSDRRKSGTDQQADCCSSDCCCGGPKGAPQSERPQPSPENVRENVRAGYAKIAQEGGWSAGSSSSSSAAPAGGCCGGGGCCGSAAFSPEQLAAALGYSATELSAAPESANMGLSCGNPTAIASLAPGEVVLDLGSGGGFDCFIAGAKVGPTGRVIGVDMTAEMLAKARQNRCV